MRSYVILALALPFVARVEAVQAQIVRWRSDGGVSVRAPFVDVDVGPSGETRVRAPFTAVDTPGLRPIFRGPEFGAGSTLGQSTGRLRPLSAEEISPNASPAASEAAIDPAQMSWLELRRHARRIAVRLENELRRVAEGTTWMASLRPGTIRDLLAEDSERPPDGATTDQLAVILQSYDALVDSNGYPQIAGLSGFREMREALGEMVLPPQERSRRNVTQQWLAFCHDLDQFGTGATWQKFLELPAEVRDGRGDTQEVLRQVEALLARYEQVIGPEQYRAVAQLPSFEAMRRSLAAYAEVLRNRTANMDSEPAEPESLPLPKPLP